MTTDGYISGFQYLNNKKYHKSCSFCHLRLMIPLVAWWTSMGITLSTGSTLTTESHRLPLIISDTVTPKMSAEWQPASCDSSTGESQLSWSFNLYVLNIMDTVLTLIEQSLTNEPHHQNTPETLGTLGLCVFFCTAWESVLQHNSNS